MIGTIDTSPSSIRMFAIIILGVVWFYILNHPVKDEDDK
jgi:hypothetical protein